MKRIGIYGEEGNVFYLSLKELVKDTVLFLIKTDLLKALSADSANILVILINKKEEEAIDLKLQFPQLDVFFASGGKKNFSPQVKVIDIKANHRYLHFSTWSELLVKLNDQKTWLKPGLVTVKGQKDIYKFSSQLQLPELTRLDPNFFLSFLYFCQTETAWMADWLYHSSKIRLRILNKLPENRKQKRFVIECNNFYRGLEILGEGDTVAFYRLFKYEFVLLSLAEVISATEKMIEVEFPLEIYGRALQEKVIASRNEWNPGVFENLSGQEENYFCRTASVKSLLFKEYHKFLKTKFDYRDENLCDGPIRFWQAEDKVPVNRVYLPIPDICLKKATKNILSDPGQVSALYEMLGPRPISLIQGGPGSGKTFVTAVAVSQMVRAGRNALVVAHSNKALDVLLREIMNYVPEKKIFRLGNNINSVTNDRVRKRHLDYLRGESFSGVENIQKLAESSKGVVLGVTANSFVLDHTLSILLSKDSFSNNQPIILDYVLVDEASKISFTELFVIANSADKLVLIGDDDQLSKIPLPSAITDHIIQSAKDYWKDGELSFAKFFGRNKKLLADISWSEVEEWHQLYSRGDLLTAFRRAGLPIVSLQFNRRSLPTINQMINEVFGKNLIPGRFNYSISGRVTLLEVVGQERISKRSFYNPQEAKLVEEELLKFYKKQEKVGEVRLFSVAVICSYKAQVNFIKKRLRKFFLFHKVFQKQVNPKNIDDVLDKIVVTVDAYQGDQNDLIIITLTRSNEESRVGFLQDLKRLYVASTRAKDEVIFITNQQTLVTSAHLEVRKFAQNLAIFCQQHRTLVKK
ncbi:MAG: DEAD/DEAH box helicase [Patescibacteria group bacterium]|nr:DEAD/DEAH box helicase [Patescibacteria group bacterium]